MEYRLRSFAPDLMAWICNNFSAISKTKPNSKNTTINSMPLLRIKVSPVAVVWAKPKIKVPRVKLQSILRDELDYSQISV